MTDKEYEELLLKIPKPIVEKLIIPLANAEPNFHNKLMAFLFTIYSKGYYIEKREK